MARKQYLSIMIPDETRAYLDEMTEYHGVGLAEAVRALIDLGRAARDGANGKIFPQGGKWVAK
jgi:hypothetical protein